MPAMFTQQLSTRTNKKTEISRLPLTVNDHFQNWMGKAIKKDTKEGAGSDELLFQAFNGDYDSIAKLSETIWKPCNAFCVATVQRKTVVLLLCTKEEIKKTQRAKDQSLYSRMAGNDRSNNHDAANRAYKNGE